MEPEVFLQMMAYICGHEKFVEIAGFGVVEDGVLIWVYRDEDAKEVSAHVDSAAGKARIAAFRQTGKAINFQWHTHPGFGCSPSGEDINDRADTIHEYMQTQDEGEMYFAVISSLDWNIEAVRWQNGTITKSPVTSWVIGKDHDFPLDYGNSSRSRDTTYTPYYSTYKPSSSADDDDAPAYEAWWHTLGKQDQLALPANVSPSQAELEHWYLIGEWSEDPKDYQYLFDAFGIKDHNFLTLWREVGDIMGSYWYDYLIDSPHVWEAELAPYIEKGELNEPERATIPKLGPAPNSE